MAKNSSNIGLGHVDIRRGGSWLYGWVSEISLRNPALHARRILRSYPESYARNLYKLFWGTCRLAAMKDTDVLQAWNKLFGEHPKKHFLAAIILGSIATRQASHAHIAYQKLQDANQRNQIKDIERRQNDLESTITEISRLLPNAVAHSIRRKEKAARIHGGKKSGNTRRKSRNEWVTIALEEARRLQGEGTAQHYLVSKTELALKNKHNIIKSSTSIRAYLQEDGIIQRRD